MNAKNPPCPGSLASALPRIAALVPQAAKHAALPELDVAMRARPPVTRGGPPIPPNPRKLLSIRLPADVIERWKQTGPGWQTRMAERLSSI